MVTRAEAVASALTTSTRHTLARLDSASAFAQWSGARQYENPSLATSYSGAAPQAHFMLDVPIDWPGQRASRIAASRALLGAATVRLWLADALLAFDTDTAYTRGQALDAQARLLVLTAHDADSLVTLVRVRRDAGDASDLDVEIATVAAAQSANIALTALAGAASATLRVQLLMGISPESLLIALADSIEWTPSRLSDARRMPRVTGAGQAVSVAAATLDVRAAAEQERLERRRRLGSPAITVGVEAINPGGPGGLLPLVGLSLPLPLFNRNQAAIAQAQADLQRSRALLAQAELVQQTAVRVAQNDAVAARTRAERSLRLLAAAERINALSLLAYREGATTLVTVLEAQRTTRDARVQSLDDLAAVQIADRVLQLLSLRIPAVQ
ncbi:TolC family protein [Gemmatimonas sp.]|uniref:TolC family protein n=1 Tax=Gemmatimonas sp. TaxID=1962908 RepID=UPI003983425B